MSSLALQKAIINKVKGSSELQALLGDPVPIFDYVTEDVQPPYLVYMDMVTRELNTVTDIGGDHAIRISCYSYYEGSKVVRQAMESIRTLLDYQPLSLEESSVVLVQVVNMSVNVVTDKTYVGVMSIQVLTEQWS